MRAEKQKEACQFPFCLCLVLFFVFFGKCSEKKQKQDGAHGWK